MSDATQTLKYLVVTKGHKIVYPTTSMDVVGAFTVDNLKKAMWEKYSHRDVGARRLNVYCPSISLGDEEEDEDEDSDDQELIQDQVAEAFGNKQIVKLKSQQLVQGITQTLIIEIPRFRPLPVYYLLIDHANNSLGSPEQVSAESITDLRHRVKDQHANDLQHVDASKLVVWHCEPKLFTKATTDEIKALNFKTAAVKLTADDISDLGLDYKEMLIIQMPGTVPVPVSYILVNHENNALGSPDQVSAESITNLRHRIKDQNANDLQHVDASNLVVWRFEPKLFATATTDEIKALNFETAAVKLNAENIRGLGLEDGEMLIIQMPAPIQPTNIPILSKPVRALRDETLQPILAPSEFKSDQLLAYQTPGSKHRILCDRPSNLRPTIPVTLLHPILNEFSQDCETYELKIEDHRFAQALSVMSRFFPEELDRKKLFTDIFTNNGIGLGGHSVSGTKYTTDGTIHVKNWPCLIVELKLETGSTGAEPVFQTAAYYGAYLHQKEKKDNFTFPCIGMYVVGPLIGFFGMALTTRVNMQMLGHPLRLDCHDTDVKQWEAITRHLGALRVAVRKLEEMYAKDTFEIEVQIGTEAAGDPIFFPAYCDFKTLEGRGAKVSYSQQLFKEKLLFYGICSFEDGEEVEVCIKFVRQYSLKAHKWCASEIFAPRVIGFTDLGGGWKMVVMERIDESFQMVKDMTRMTRTVELYDLIKEKLTGLHQQGYVHGDVRDVNVMVKVENGKYSMRLLDFDWAGEIGETRYPLHVKNSRNVRRPREVYDRERIKAEHDIKMLDYMFCDIVGSGDGWWILEPKD